VCVPNCLGLGARRAQADAKIYAWRK